MCGQKEGLDDGLGVLACQVIGAGPSDQSEVVLTMGKDGEGWRQLLWASLYLKNPFWVFGPS